MGIIYYLGNIGTPWTTVLGSASIFQKPLVAGTLVGLILGHPIEGVIIGAAIQLPYIAYISAGGTIPSDPGLAGVLGTAFAIVGGMDPATAEKGDLHKVCFYHVVPPQIFMFLICVIPVTLGAYFGSGYMTSLVAMLSERVLHVLQVIGGVLPALGVAMNLRSISRPNTMAFYMIGFVLSVYMGLDTIVIAVIGFIIAWFYAQARKEESVL